MKSILLAPLIALLTVVANEICADPSQTLEVTYMSDLQNSLDSAFMEIGADAADNQTDIILCISPSPEATNGVLCFGNESDTLTIAPYTNVTLFQTDTANSKGQMMFDCGRTIFDIEPNAILNVRSKSNTPAHSYNLTAQKGEGSRFSQSVLVQPDGMLYMENAIFTQPDSSFASALRNEPNGTAMLVFCQFDLHSASQTGGGIRGATESETHVDSSVFTIDGIADTGEAIFLDNHATLNLMRSGIFAQGGGSQPIGYSPNSVITGCGNRGNALPQSTNRDLDFLQQPCSTSVGTSLRIGWMVTAALVAFWCSW